MFSFYIGKPIIEYSDNTCYIDIDGFGRVLSGGTRRDFIEAGINEVLETNYLNTIGSGHSIIIKYTEVEDILEKIRFKSKIYGTGELWVNEVITDARNKYPIDELFCMFE